MERLAPSVVDMSIVTVLLFPHHGPVAQSSGKGMLITAADVVNSATDSGQLVPMLEQAEEMIGESVPVTLADGGYHTAANLASGEQRGDLFVMPERYHPGVQGP